MLYYEIMSKGRKISILLQNYFILGKERPAFLNLFLRKRVISHPPAFLRFFSDG